MERIREFNNPPVPHVCNMIDYFLQDNTYYIVMEYCSGGELFDKIIEKKTFNEIEAALLIKDIIEAVCALHKVGIVHRDMKPQNILLVSNASLSNIWDYYKVKIIDFGLAKIIDEMDSKRVQVGTTSYIAPEVFAEQLYTPACDVWSCGVILYILLAGYSPFHSSTPEKTESKIREGVYIYYYYYLFFYY